MAWSFILTGRDHTPVGEVLNAKDRRVAIPHSKLATLSLRVRLDNPLADQLLECDGYVKAYRNGVIQFHGPIISAEEVVERNEASVGINCVDAGWILSKRLAGKSANGASFTAVDRAVIVKNLIDSSNTENETGIDTSGSISAASSVNYTAGPYKFISDVIGELAPALDGFDWRVTPIDNFSGGAVTGQKIGSFIAAPTLGTYRQEALFEYGGIRSNVVSYRRAVSRDTQANKVYHNAQAGPDAVGYPTMSAIDSTSITDWKLLEDLAQADLLDSAMRQQLVDEHVRVRAQPRQVIEFVPHIDPQGSGRIPQFGVDFEVGDLLPARASYNKKVRVDGDFRVWGVEFETDDLGLEKMALTLAEE